MFGDRNDNPEASVPVRSFPGTSFIHMRRNISIPGAALVIPASLDAATARGAAACRRRISRPRHSGIARVDFFEKAAASI